MQDTSPGISAELVQQVDAELAKDLANIANLRDPFFSPVAYGEVQLTVGCSDESPACLSAIAETAQADAVIIRQLLAGAEGGERLRLVYFRRSSGQPPVHAEVATSPEHRAQLVESVADLVRAVLGLMQARLAGPPAGSSAAGPGPRASASAPTPLTWIMLGAGAAVLIPGVALALSADADYDDYRRAQVDSREDVQRARRDFESIETRATWANVLIPAGALTLGVGAVLLAVDLSASDGADERGATQLLVAPSAGGGVVALRGTLGEPL